MRIALLDFLAQNVGLRVLAPKAQHRRTGNVGMVQIPGNQSTEVPGIFARAAASPLVGEELDSIHVLKQSMYSLVAIFGRLSIVLNGVHSPFTIQMREFTDLLAIDLGRSVSEPFFEGFAQNVDIAVLAEDQRYNQPVITRACLAVSASVAQELAILPRRYMRSVPFVVAGFLMKV